MKKFNWIGPAALTALLLLVAGPLAAQTEINETRPLDATATLTVSNVSGSVKITGWNRDELEVTGTLGEGAEELRISGDASRMEVEVVLPKNSRNVKPTHLVLSVPRGCRLNVDTVSANIDLQDFDGDIELESVSGDVAAVCGAGDAEVSSVSGEISLECQSSNTRVESVSGDVRVRGVLGELSGSTVSGDFIVEGGLLSRIKVESVSGNLQFDVGLDGASRVEVESHSGDVVFLLSGAPQVDVSVDTFSGSIRNEFGIEGISDKYSKGTVLWEGPGGGSGMIEIDTFSGDVLLKQK